MPEPWQMAEGYTFQIVPIRAGYVLRRAKSELHHVRRGHFLSMISIAQESYSRWSFSGGAHFYTIV